jgi:hypothetical protein
LPHYILLINWTEQGISKIKESSDRYNSFKASLEKVGGKLIGGYYSNVSDAKSWLSWKCENQNPESI